MDSELKDYLNKCRCCLEDLEDNSVVNLTDFFMEKFFEVTQCSLISSEHLSTKICNQCNSEMTRMAELRNRFIDNQNTLINLLSKCSVKVEHEPDDFNYDNPMVDVFIKQESELNVEDVIKFETPYFTEESEEEEEIPAPKSRRKPPKSRQERHEKREKKQETEKKVRRRGRAPKGTIFSCEICHKLFKSQFLIREHTQMVHEKIKNFFCDVEGCGYASYQKYTYLLHKFNRHGGEHPTRKEGYFCETCGARFRNPTKLRDHVERKHIGIKKYQCDHCPMRFFKKEDIRKHILNHIPKEHRGFSAPCDECGKMFYNIYTMKSHKELYHQRIRKFSCELCGKLYESRTRLNIHIDSFHKGLKEFECNICNGRYITKLALRGYIKRQHPETLGLEKKKFPCSFCDHVCPSKLGLQYHEKKHGEPQFPCDKCNKKYFTRYQLLDHQEVHQRLEFKCEHCVRSFRQEKRLLHHQKRVHFKEKTTFRCEICNSTFTRRTTLRDHVLKLHPALDEAYKNDLIARIMQMLPEEKTGGN